jgi:cation diffusion facilitator CzcD-associated flavoprotein CzcO
LILERDSEVGGTWHANSYPGCACDVPSHLYSFSFAPNPDWKHAFSRQPQILDYLKGVARAHGLYPKIRFNTALTGAQWDDLAGHWILQTAAGSFTADRVVLGTGGLSDPSIPALPGLETFAGTTFHSATWNHDHDLSNDRVAVVGTGASAIQFVPHVQQAAAHLTLFQRTAPWVLPRHDRPYRNFERRLNRLVPGLQRAIRLRMYSLRELWLVGFTLKPALLKVAENVALRHLKRQVPYPALSQPNVEVLTDRIVEVRPRSIVTASAAGVTTEHPVDTIIFGTGFHVTDPPAASLVRGRDGRTLAEHWRTTGMSALNGTTITGFPNLFMLVGPNTGLGHNSIVLMIEAQVRYLLSLIQQMDQQNLATAESLPAAQQAYNDGLQRKLEKTVWNTGGCESWYLDSNGRNTTLWPTFTFEFMRQLRRADLSEYAVERKAAEREKIPA